MIICKESVDGLRFLGNSCTVSDENFIKLLEMCVDIIVNNEETRGVSHFSNSKVDVMKGACAALLSLLVEATRHNVDAEMLSSVLSQDFNFTSARSEKLVKYYFQNRSKLEAALSCIGSHPPHIVDASWTLDYCIKTGSLEHAGVVQYLIQFHVESSDSTVKFGKTSEIVRFICSLEELQDIVGKLRDAVKHVERVAAV
ncbi:COMM domain-containing protein 3 [Anabrus simplex]|uniref:COMM domain-containing protein 3 n=1 Tax=Anabrus simplex TaxID=316456 RepID=UPI0035A2CB1F